MAKVLTLPGKKPIRPHWTSFARGKRTERGEMNQTEKRYAEYLGCLRDIGQIEWFSFEGITLRLAKGLRLTPDFFVMRAGGVLECHEVKGFWADDAKAKVKMAAELFPFRFIAVKALAKKHGGGWKEEVF